MRWIDLTGDDSPPCISDKHSKQEAATRSGALMIASRGSWFAKLFDRAWGEWLLVLSFFTALAVVVTWPLVLQAGSSVIGRYGDNMHFVWMQGWFGEALLERGQLPYQVPILNYPEGWNLARSEIPSTLMLIGLLPGRLGSPVLGYNLGVFLTFIFSGAFTYAWIKRLTGSIGAGLVSGAAFAMVPFRIAHFRAGHLNVLATMWLPLALIGLTRLLTNPKQAGKEAILLGAAIGLLAHSSMYMTYLTLLVIGLASALYLLLISRKTLRMKEFWRQLGLAGIVGIPLTVSALLPYLSLAKRGSIQSRSVFAVAGGSASLSDFLLPSTDHFLWGGWIADHFSRNQWIEGSLYLGVVVASLAVVGLVSSWRDRSRRGSAILLVFIGGLALIFALGTHLHWNEQMVRLNLPRSLAGALGRGDVSIRLPTFYLYQVLPFFDRLRTFKRVGVVVLLAVISLAGMGIAWLERRYRFRGIVLLIFGLIFLDYYAGPFGQVSPVGPRPVDRWLQAQPGQGAVVEFPFSLQTEQVHVYYTLENGKPYLGGFFSAFPPDQFQRIEPVMAGFPDEASVVEMRALGVDYVLVNRGYYSELEVQRINHVAEILGLSYAGRLGLNDLYLLPKSDVAGE